MDAAKLADKMAGRHTLESAAALLGVKPASARNVLTRLKRAGYLRAHGPKGFRRYDITPYKQLPRSPGIYDVLNKYNPDFQLVEWPDHQVHSKYEVEDAIVDAVKSGDFRKTLATLRLFNHVTDWKRLFRIASNADVWQKVGALYDAARVYMRVRKMPLRYRHKKFSSKAYLFSGRDTKEDKLKPVAARWNVEIPLTDADVYDVLVRYHRTEK